MQPQLYQGDCGATINYTLPAAWAHSQASVFSIIFHPWFTCSALSTLYLTVVDVSVLLNPLYASMESRRYSYENLLVYEGAEQSKSMEDLIISNQLRRSWAYSHRRAIALHLGLISFYTALSCTVFWLLRAQGVQCHRPSLIYSRLLWSPFKKERTSY